MLYEKMGIKSASMLGWYHQEYYCGPLTATLLTERVTAQQYRDFLETVALG